MPWGDLEHEWHGRHLPGGREMLVLVPCAVKHGWQDAAGGKGAWAWNLPGSFRLRALLARGGPLEEDAAVSL